MVGKLHKSWPGGHVYMLVVVDKFTKWVEAAPVTTQDSTAAINFIKSIVFCFGVPYSIITDNGTNFTSKEFKNYCEGLGIKLKFASVAHPKTNGQVEKANGLICSGIKKEAISTSRESQERLGRRIALRSLKPQNYA
jgi:transposase InsO family protein